MKYLVTVGEDVIIAPSSLAEEVMQNVRTILSTIKYSVPLDRDFGIRGDAIDRPIHLAKARLTHDIFRAIRRYEPRAVIEAVGFEGEETGRLTPLVTVSIHESGGGAT